MSVIDSSNTTVTNGDDPTPHQLRLLLILAEELHFGRAARRLYLTQPALSQQIRALEDRLRVRVFQRTSRHVELTEAGRELLPHARRVVTAADDLRRAAYHLAVGDDTLRIGVCESFGSIPEIRAVLDAFASPQPQVRVLETFTAQLTALERGEIDAAFVHLPVPPGLRAQPLLVEPRLACLSATDPLAARDTLCLADLAEHPVAEMSPSTFPEGREFWTANPRPDGARARPAESHGSTFESLLNTVALARAVAFVPAAAARLYPRPDLAYVPVTDLPPCTFALVWNETTAQSPRSERLRAAVTEVAPRG
ncbi:LysR family transcriptional regulator [Nocardia sp. NPDC050799]|uniref:LysR family transcriptional regulator n=1 Tax=Nocardia sp. NPDC050799 TaxID=3154842 RepID=UPI0033C0BB0D